MAPPAGAVPAACTRLREALPDTLDGRDRRETRPRSDATAAWGSPPVRLRCGVPRPAALTATSEILEVNGVEWFLDEQDGAYVFTTVHRRTYVEVRVPAATPRAQAVNPLVDLAEPVRGSVPAA